ncbi:MAG: hypothetical protein EXX96DRAFT_546717 [Benjaminiella poitrasii]|nr:MAG: hypothetical protein EXX96DRAFT_546717 [Benjaminiella poitrasii]
MCNVNDPRITDAYIAIIEDQPTDWLILGYKDTRDVISLYSTGTNGLSEFRNKLTNEILFGYVRIEDKFISITYVPDSIRALVHSRAVADILELSHAQITASSLSDLSDKNIRTRLNLGQKKKSQANLANHRPRSAIISKRPSFNLSQQQQRNRKSGTYNSFSSQIELKNDENKLKLNTTAITYTEEPYVYEDCLSDRMSTTTPTPSTPTSSSYTGDSTQQHFFAIADNAGHSVIDNNLNLLTEGSINSFKRLQDQTDTMLQYQLSKKKELEEARFRQFQQDQREERFKIQQEESLKNSTKKKEMPKWQQELQRRKLKKQQELEMRQELEKKKKAGIIETGLKTAIRQSSLKPSINKTNVISEQHQDIFVISAKEDSVEVKPVKKSQVESAVEVEIIMSGFISVQTYLSPFWKRRYFTIDNHGLIFYKDEVQKETIAVIPYSSIEQLRRIDEDEDAYVPNAYVVQNNLGDSYQMLADDKKTGKQIYTTLIRGASYS